MVVATLITVCQIVFFSRMAAYAFARLHWRGRDLMFGLFLAGLMVPTIFTLLPNFVLIKRTRPGRHASLGHRPARALFMTPFAVFFLRQFFLNLPREVEEAALLDGAGQGADASSASLLPMASAPIITLASSTYITAWNDYFWPLMVSYSDSSRAAHRRAGRLQAQTPADAARLGRA